MNSYQNFEISHIILTRKYFYDENITSFFKTFPLTVNMFPMSFLGYPFGVYQQIVPEKYNLK